MVLGTGAYARCLCVVAIVTLYTNRACLRISERGVLGRRSGKDCGPTGSCFVGLSYIFYDYTYVRRIMDAPTIYNILKSCAISAAS